MPDKTLGAYERHEAPDYMDGGVTAAQVEKEAEHLPATNPSAEYWMHEHNRRAAQIEALNGALAKAEQERNEARATKDMHKARADEERARADAAESRPLTPDAIAITDEMVERAWAWASRHELYGSGSVRILLEEALTEPPGRPEGAEELEADISRDGEDAPFDLTPEHVTALADHLAALGWTKERS